MPRCPLPSRRLVRPVRLHRVNACLARWCRSPASPEFQPETCSLTARLIVNSHPPLARTGTNAARKYDRENIIMPGIIAILPAAGFGTRMGGESPKQFRLLDGVPVLL